MMLKNKHHGTLEKAEICKHQLWVQKKVMLIKKNECTLPITIRKLTVLSNFKSKVKHLLFNKSGEYMRAVNRYI